MANIDISRNYATGSVLVEADLDAIQSSITTFFNTTKINADNIQGNALNAETKFINSSVSTALIADEAVTTEKLADSAITTAKLASASVGTTELATACIDGTLIPDNAVTTDKILDDQITTDKIVAGAVTDVKRVVPTRATGTFDSSSTTGTSFSTFKTITGLSLTASRPVFINMGPSSSSNSYVATPSSSTAYYSSTYELQIQVSTDGGTNYTTIYNTLMRVDVGGNSANGNQRIPQGCIWTLFTPSSTGTHIIRFQHKGYYTAGSSTHITGTVDYAVSIHEVL